MYNVEDIRELFRNLKAYNEVRGNTYEISPASFIADSPTIFGCANKDYIAAEIAWYESCSPEVSKLFSIYGKEVKIWKDVADGDGLVNSNYGIAIYARERGYQYANCVQKLRENAKTRQASMIYCPTNIHEIAGKDFICTYATSHRIENGHLDTHVYMRSNDAIFGYANDYGWHRHILHKLANDTNTNPRSIYWHASSLHIYDRHWDLIK